ncbi:MAG: hypothetical protein ACI8Y4_004059 [Candidatus Poriferisodalaceae bacterium]
MVAVPCLASFLAREWTLEREILHRDSDTSARIRGAAFWEVAEAGALTYVERGVLEVGGYVGDVRQSYRFSIRTPTSADVFFADGRPFHTVDLANGRSDITHLCEPDTYLGIYEVTSTEELRVTWDVRGPRKDYLSTTTLRPGA